MREIELVDPFSSIARRRLSAGSATMSRQGIGSQRVPALAACVLPICSARQRKTSVILSFFFLFQGTFVLHRYALSYPRIREFHERLNSSPSPPSLPPPSFRSSAAISRGIYGGFVAPVYRHAERFAFRAASRCCFVFVSENSARREIPSDGERFANESYKKWIQYLLKVRTTERYRYH